MTLGQCISPGEITSIAMQEPRHFLMVTDWEELMEEVQPRVIILIVYKLKMIREMK